MDTISTGKITKGDNSAKNAGGATDVNGCTSSSYRVDTISILKITKGNNSAKNVGGVMDFNLSTSSDHAIYLCQIS